MLKHVAHALGYSLVLPQEFLRSRAILQPRNLFLACMENVGGSLTLYSYTVQHMHTKRHQLEYLHESTLNSSPICVTPRGRRVNIPVVSGSTQEDDVFVTSSRASLGRSSLPLLMVIYWVTGLYPMSYTPWLKKSYITYLPQIPNCQCLSVQVPCWVQSPVLAALGACS